MREFDEEVMEKKRLARNNRYRRGWGESRTKGFERPELTDSEIRERHGNIMEYKIGHPISWVEFKSYPKEIQQEWLNTFVEKFRCSTKGMEILFGIKNTSINTYCKHHEISIPKNGFYTDEKGEAIRAWIAEHTPSSPAPAPVEPKKPEPKQPKKTELPYFVNTIQHGSMQLTGNATEIFQTLFGIFRDARLELNIEFAVMPAPVEPEPVPEEPPEPTEPTEPEQDAPDQDSKLNVNKCTFKDLRAIGVSPNIAANIMQARPFQAVDDLARVAGISKGYFNVLREKVTVFDEV